MKARIMSEEENKPMAGKKNYLHEPCFFCGKTTTDAVKFALMIANGNKTKAAEMMNIQRTTLIMRCHILGIPVMKESQHVT